jgi:hypothetical protein
MALPRKRATNAVIAMEAAKTIGKWIEMCSNNI